MALDRKFDALLDVHPDIAIVSECAEPGRFRARLKFDRIKDDPVWIGQNPNKGLAVFTFNGYTACLSKPYYRTLQYIAPVHIFGPVACNVLGGLGTERKRRRQTQESGGAATHGAEPVQAISVRPPNCRRWRPQ